jgi:hypothetical protein
MTICWPVSLNPTATGDRLWEIGHRRGNLGDERNRRVSPFVQKKKWAQFPTIPLPYARSCGWLLTRGWPWKPKSGLYDEYATWKQEKRVARNKATDAQTI